MRQEKSFRSEAAVITTGLAMGESPRWHDIFAADRRRPDMKILVLVLLGHKTTCEAATQSQAYPEGI